MLSPSARTNAIYAAVSAQALFSKLNSAEQAQVKANILSIWGTGDLTYLIASTVVNPTAMQDPGGAAVVTAGSATAQTGTVTSPVAIVGTGTIS